MKNLKFLSKLFLGALLLLITSCNSEDNQDSNEFSEETVTALSRNAIASMSTNLLVSNDLIDFNNCPGTILEFSFENEVDGLYDDTTFAIAGSFGANSSFENFIANILESLNEQNNTSYTIDDFVLNAISVSVFLDNNTFDSYYLTNNNDIIDYFEDCVYDGDVLPTNNPLYTGACYSPELIYPLGVQVEDVNSGVVSVVTVNDEYELYMLFETPSSESNQVPVDLSYPVQLEDYEGNIITVNNTDELFDALNSEICVE